MNEPSSNSLEYALWRNPGARISRSTYHEGNPGARILGEYVSWRKSWSTNPGGVCIMKELLGHKFLTNMFFFVFFQEKPGARCMYHEPKIIKNPGKIVICTIPQDFPSPRFFGKKRWKREKKNNLVWSTNVPGERISLENESLETPIGKIVVRKILVRKPRQKTAASKPQQFVPSHE